MERVPNIKVLRDRAAGDKTIDVILDDLVEMHNNSQIKEICVVVIRQSPTEGDAPITGCIWTGDAVTSAGMAAILQDTILRGYE